MQWDDTPWIKLYRTSPFSCWHVNVSLQARGLFDELLKVLDKYGMLPLLPGSPADTVARAVNGPPEYVAEYLGELLDEGCVVLGEYHGQRVLICRNFVEAQAARASTRLRMAEFRARERDSAANSKLTAKKRQLTLGPRNGSVMVSAKPLRSDQNRIEENREQPSPSAPLEAQATTHYVAGAPGSPEWEAMKATLPRSPQQEEEAEARRAFLEEQVKVLAAKKGIP